MVYTQEVGILNHLPEPVVETPRSCASRRANGCRSQGAAHRPGCPRSGERFLSPPDECGALLALLCHERCQRRVNASLVRATPAAACGQTDRNEGGGERCWRFLCNMANVIVSELSPVQTQGPGADRFHVLGDAGRLQTPLIGSVERTSQIKGYTGAF